MDKQIFLSFGDYIKSKQDPVGWITVGRIDSRSEPDSRYTFSIMASLDAKDDLLKEYKSEISYYNFGIPTFQLSDDSVAFDTGQMYTEKQITFEPFVIRREFHGVHDSTFDVIQNFILYHSLFFDPKQNAYLDVIEDEKVIEYVSPSHVRISEKYLRDYLAARKMVLVKYHDHRRHSAVSVLDTFGEERKEISITNCDHNYSIMIGQYGMNGEAFSRLLGKDIVLPYPKPKHQDYLLLSGEPQRYEKYAYKIGDDGNEIEESCDQESKNSTGRFLTSIFFKKEVLDKYYSKPRFYEIKDGEIYYLDLWSIPFGENVDGLIHVWLGDLGRIPHNEQIHWKVYNVVPGKSLSKNFVGRQLLGKFTAKDDLCDKLLDLKTSVNDMFVSGFNFKLFMDLPETREYVSKTFHTLTTDEEAAFDIQILNMAKLFVDTINKADLESNTTWRPSNSDENKSLHFLEHFLDEALGNCHHAKTVVSAFRMVQRLRSETGAHVPGSDYGKTLQRFNLDNLNPKARFTKVLEEFHRKLDFLNQIGVVHFRKHHPT